MKENTLALLGLFRLAAIGSANTMHGTMEEIGEPMRESSTIMKLCGHFAISVAVVVSLCAVSANAQSFVNLNFEQATLSPSQGGFVSIASALPDWTAYLGGVQQTEVVQNLVAVDSPTVGILGPGLVTLWDGLNIIDGNYTVLLQSGVNISPENAFIAQTGTVPLKKVQSLTFKAWELEPYSTFSVSFAGNSLTPVLLSTGTAPSGQPYDVYGVDISPYRGQTGQLEFTQNYYGPPAAPAENALLLDDIGFSAQAVLEPSPVVLTGLAGVLFSFGRNFLSRGSGQHLKCIA